METENTKKKKYIYSDEKKKEYLETRKEKNRKLRENKRQTENEGRESERNLYFLEQIIQSLGLTWREFGEAAGFSQQLTTWWKTVDDIKLSNLEQCFKAFNMTIEPEFVSLKAENEKINLHINSETFEVIGNIPKMGQALEQKDFIEDCFQNKKRLFFLAKFIKETGLPIRQFCLRMEMDQMSMKHYFITDEIKVKTIYRIAKAYDQKVLWKLNEIKD